MNVKTFHIFFKRTMEYQSPDKSINNKSTKTKACTVIDDNTFVDGLIWFLLYQY